MGGHYSAFPDRSRASSELPAMSCARLSGMLCSSASNAPAQKWDYSFRCSKLIRLPEAKANERFICR